MLLPSALAISKKIMQQVQQRYSKIPFVYMSIKVLVLSIVGLTLKCTIACAALENVTCNIHRRFLISYSSVIERK